MAVFPELAGRLSDAELPVELRLASEWDIPDILIAHQDDPQMHRRLGRERPPSGAELGRRSEQEPAARLAGTGLRFTILEPGDDTCRGQLDAHAVNWEHRRAELGIWIAPQRRGRGLAAAALRLAAAWLFEACGLERLGLLTDPDNEPMRRAALAAGFVEEGVLRSYERLAGRRDDLVSMSLLPADLRSHPGTPLP